MVTPILDFIDMAVVTPVLDFTDMAVVTPVLDFTDMAGYLLVHLPRK